MIPTLSDLLDTLEQVCTDLEPGHPARSLARNALMSNIETRLRIAQERGRRSGYTEHTFQSRGQDMGQ